MKIVLVFVAMLGSVLGFIEQYIPSSPIVVIKELKKSTVTLSDVKVYLRYSSTEPWIEVHHDAEHDESSTMAFDAQDLGVQVEMSVYEAPKKDWHSLTRVGSEQYVSKMTQTGSKVNFLWTSSSVGYYMFLFRVAPLNTNRQVEIGLDVITYEGRPEDPSIYSHTDSQIKNKEKRMLECFTVSKEIQELQDLDKMEEGAYTKVTNGIFRIVVLTVFLKIVVFIGSFMVINRKIQDFYVAKKIVAVK
ncbi:hypothetical protein NECID01_1549 [Nematocida sp. AWRm77]|nr:hypothetical protein NECID01_1549 [Nematocida sp. AWRm77]